MSQSPSPSANQDTSYVDSISSLRFLTLLHRRTLKRKYCSDDDHFISKEENDLPPGSSIPKGEYASGLIQCDICGTLVSFRNEFTKEFTLSHWNHHRETWQVSSLSLVFYL
jgi:hypothetical protein